MLKVTRAELERAEAAYPGIGETIDYYESLELPACGYCGSADTAVTSTGIVGRSVTAASATTKVKLRPNGQGGLLWCNTCGKAGEAVKR